MERERERTSSTQWNYVGMKTALQLSGCAAVAARLRSPASSGGRRRAVQGNLPQGFTAAAAAAAAELVKGPAQGWSCGCRRGAVHFAGAVGERRVRGRSRRPGARQRGGGGRSPGRTHGFVAGGIALRPASARAVLTLLLRMSHLHLLAVGSNPVLER